MKIKINNKEHNWYLTDLENYTPEFLIEIIRSLVNGYVYQDDSQQGAKDNRHLIEEVIPTIKPVDTNNQEEVISQPSNFKRKLNVEPEIYKGSKDIQSKHKELMDKDYEEDVRYSFEDRSVTNEKV